MQTKDFRPLPRLILFILCCALSHPLLSAEQLDGRSTADIRISLTILQTIKIETTTDVRLDIQDRTIDANFAESFCVRGNAESKYRVVAHGSIDNENRFTLNNSEGERLAYTLFFRGKGNPAKFETLQPGTPSPVYDSTDQKSDCTDGAAFSINFEAKDLEAATSGLFSGALTLLVSPI
ncbi:MAG: hypothetical protein JKY88_09370 [Pseudomonadales bacterium]|nr:hypothetical protein [Pseudomonadales bacterium]